MLLQALSDSAIAAQAQDCAGPLRVVVDVIVFAIGVMNSAKRLITRWIACSRRFLSIGVILGVLKAR